jgi:multidrug resistance efflux pump
MRTVEGQLGRFIVTLAAVAVAAVIGWQLWVYYMEAPWTRDGQVRADVVGVTPDVSGPVAEVLVHDNQIVKRGQVLFRIDPTRFQLALDQAQAVLASKTATEQQSMSDMNRMRTLSSLKVSTEEQQQYTAKAAKAGAEYDKAVAGRNVAQLDLERATVRASVNGIVANFSLRPGDYVTAGTAKFALIDTDSLRVDGYFEETKLPYIKVGDRARVHLMGESAVIDGHVQSIAGGISDRQLSDSPILLANVRPTFAWVRLPQRIPVRIAIDHVPDGISLILGRTATVEVLNAGRPKE